jgi:hypothetical protein
MSKKNKKQQVVETKVETEVVDDVNTEEDTNEEEVDKEEPKSEDDKAPKEPDKPKKKRDWSRFKKACIEVAKGVGVAVVTAVLTTIGWYFWGKHLNPSDIVENVPLLENKDE